MAAAPAPRGALPRMLASWRAPGAFVRSLRGVREGTLAATLLAAALMLLVAQLPAHARAAALDPSMPLSARVAGAALGVVFLLPLAAYALAALSAVFLRAARRPVSGADARLALFWALLAVAPAMLLAGLTEGLAGPSPALVLVRAVAGLGFLWIWLGGLAALARP